MERASFLTEVDSEVFRDYITPARQGLGGNFDSPLNDGITNLRAALRWVNSIRTSYSYLKGECEISDLADCELLKAQAPAVYNALRKNWEVYTELPQAGHGLKLWNEEEAKKRNRNSWDFVVNSYKRELFKEDFYTCLDDTTKVRVNNILKRLLPEYGSRLEKGFNNSIYIDRYFYQILQDSEISDYEFKELMRLEVDDIKEKIQDSYTLKEMSLKLHLSKYVPSNKTEVEKLFRVYFYCGVIFERFLLDPYTLYFNIKDSVRDLSEIKKNIERAVDENIPSLFFDYFFYLIGSQSPSNTWDRILTEEDTTQYKLNQLKRAITANYCLSDVISFFTQLTEFTYDRAKNDKIPVYNEDAIALLKDYWTANLAQSYNKLIYKDHPNDGVRPYYLNYLVYVLWDDNLEELIDELKRINTNQSLEVVCFIDAYQANNRKSVVFKFEYLDI